MPWAELIQVGAATAMVALVVILCLWLASIPLKDVSIIDMAFSALIALVVVTAYVTAAAAGPVSKLLLVLVLTWALRMTAYLMHRNLRHGEDVRYSKLRQWVAPGGHFIGSACARCFFCRGWLSGYLHCLCR